MTILGTRDPEHPVKQRLGPGGQMIGAYVNGILRIVHLDFAVGGRKGLRSKTTVGPIIGRFRTTVLFNRTNPATPGTMTAPIPWQTENTELEFYDRGGKTIGTLVTNVIEGRAFVTPLQGAPMPAFRLGGFGPLVSGTGQFSGVQGMMSVNYLISVVPATLSNLYMFRFYDPDGKFREMTCNSWS